MKPYLIELIVASLALMAMPVLMILGAGWLIGWLMGAS
jgi:hypothetical protein